MEHELRQFGQDVRGDITTAAKRGENLLDKVLHWSGWETLLHLVLVALFVYIAWCLYSKPGTRTLNNYLILAVAVGVAVQIHQNSNVQKKLQLA